jgi:hypothetical protein
MRPFPFHDGLASDVKGPLSRSRASPAQPSGDITAEDLSFFDRTPLSGTTFPLCRARARFRAIIKADLVVRIASKKVASGPP